MIYGTGTTYYSSLYSSLSDYIKIGHRNGGYWYNCGGRTVNNISTEDYNVLVMEIDGYLHKESWQGNELRYGFKNAVEKYEGGRGSRNAGKTTINLDISNKHNTEGYIFIGNTCAHSGLPYSGYDFNSYIMLYSAYLKK